MNLHLTFGCAFLAISLFVSSNQFAQETTPQRPADSNQLAAQQAAAAQQQNQQELIRKRLVAELDLLIPGSFEAGSDREKGINDAVVAFQQGNLTETSRILKKLAETDKALPPVELLEAGLIFASGNANQGFQILEAAALKYPDYPGIYFAFGRLAILQKRLTDATALVEKAAAKTKATEFTEEESEFFRTQYYASMVDISMQQQRYDVARENLSRLEAIRPDSNKIGSTRAELDFIDQKYDSSYTRLKDYHEKNPQTALPEIVMAQWFQAIGKMDETGKWITKAAEAYPNNPIVQFQFANYAVNTNDFPKATSAIKKIEDAVGKETPETILLKAKMAFVGEAYGMAEVHYKKLLEQQPTNFDAANMYALALIESENEDKQKLALQIVQRNFQELSDNQIAQAAFGWVLWRLGEKNKAEELFTRAARSPQLAPEVAYFLANMMHDLGRSQQAKLVLEPAMKSSNMFMYRPAATSLMKAIDNSSNNSLPPPEK